MKGRGGGGGGGGGWGVKRERKGTDLITKAAEV